MLSAFSFCLTEIHPIRWIGNAHVGLNVSELPQAIPAYQPDRPVVGCPFSVDYFTLPNTSTAIFMHAVS